MRYGKDDGVPDGSAFGSEGRYDGGYWCDALLISKSSLQHYTGVRGPHDEPQRDVHQRHLGDADLGALRVGVGIAP